MRHDFLCVYKKLIRFYKNLRIFKAVRMGFQGSKISVVLIKILYKFNDLNQYIHSIFMVN